MITSQLSCYNRLLLCAMLVFVEGIWSHDHNVFYICFLSVGGRQLRSPRTLFEKTTYAERGL
jgi:hypothetical protein